MSLLLSLLLQLPSVAQPAEQPPPGLPLHPTRSHSLEFASGLGRGPAGLLGFGPGWSARFDSGSTQLELVDPTETLAATRIELSLHSIRLGSRELVTVAESARHPLDVGRDVLVPVAPGIHEVYTVHEQGLEHSLLLEQQPNGPGDLVVDVRVTGNVSLPSGRFDSGLSLGESGHVPLRVGSVEVVDHAGTRFPGQLWCSTGGWRYVVEEAVLSEARYPLLVDPFLTDELPHDFGHPIRDVELAYDATHEVYGAVVRRLSGSFCYFQRFDPDGAVVGDPIPLGHVHPLGRGENTAIANVSETDRFVLALQYVPEAIAVLSIDPWVGGSIQGSQHLPAPTTSFGLGGDPSGDWDRVYALLAWVDSETLDIRSTLVGTYPNGDIWLDEPKLLEPALNGNTDYDDPFDELVSLEREIDVSKSCGQEGHWFIAWYEYAFDASGGPDISATGSLGVSAFNQRFKYANYWWPSGPGAQVASDGLNFYLMYPLDWCTEEGSKPFWEPGADRARNKIVAAWGVLHSAQLGVWTPPLGHGETIDWWQWDTVRPGSPSRFLTGFDIALTSRGVVACWSEHQTPSVCTEDVSQHIYQPYYGRLKAVGGWFYMGSQHLTDEGPFATGEFAVCSPYGSTPYSYSPGADRAAMQLAGGSSHPDAAFLTWIYETTPWQNSP